MVTKEKLKKEIDELPQDLLKQVYQFIYSVKGKTGKKSRVRSFKLKGQFDDINIRGFISSLGNCYLNQILSCLPPRKI